MFNIKAISMKKSIIKGKNQEILRYRDISRGLGHQRSAVQTNEGKKMECCPETEANVLVISRKRKNQQLTSATGKKNTALWGSRQDNEYSSLSLFKLSLTLGLSCMQACPQNLEGRTW